ncbi:ABC transporter ATP-binding protein [Jannaschia sp. R86511]|uniref:ABC transporter ATP-binding protein n=1 Tax=Jannaschia sp. R86511 TaxID=3093853 RepID=UPI0036D43A50
MSPALPGPHAATGTLIAHGLRLSFGDLLVLDRVDVQVSAGQTLALLGPSGCGKSTLLRVLAGFETADEGSLTLDGHEVVGPSPLRGMVAQAGTLFPWLTVRDNIAFGPRQTGAADVAGTVRDLLAVTGLSEFADALPRQLSGGMRQRAAIAQVLANRPPVLLLDEPFGALDAQTRLRMHEWLRGLLTERPTTTVLVTHDVEEALLLGDRLGLISARPARVQSVRDLPFGADRGRHTLVDPAFAGLRAEVLEQVLTA